MTTVPAAYRPMLDELDPDWRDAKRPRYGAAAVAVAVNVLSKGSIKAQCLPDFSSVERRIAERRLRENGYIEEDEFGKLALAWESDDIGDGIGWALLMACGEGYIEVSRR